MIHLNILANNKKRSILLFFTLVTLSFLSYGQEIPSNSAHYDKVGSIRALKKALSSDSLSEMEKAQKIYTWLGRKVRYDVNSYKKHEFLDYNPKKVIRRRKGLCGDYSRTFIYLAKIAGIKAFEVTGYLKNSEQLRNQPVLWANHSWVVFIADETFFIADPTAASGFTYTSQPYFNKVIRMFLPGYPYRSQLRFRREFSEDYFRISPVEAVHTYLASAPFYQLVSCPVALQDFILEDIKIDSLDTCLNYKREIFALANWSENERIFYEAKRAHEFNPDNNECMIKAHILKANEKLIALNTGGPDQKSKKIKAVYKDYLQSSRYNARFKTDLVKIKDFRLSKFAKRNHYIQSYLNGSLIENRQKINASPIKIKTLKAENYRILKSKRLSKVPEPFNYSRSSPRKSEEEVDKINYKISQNKTDLRQGLDTISYFSNLLTLNADSLVEAKKTMERFYKNKSETYSRNRNLINKLLFETARFSQIHEIEPLFELLTQNKLLLKEPTDKAKFERSVTHCKRQISYFAQKNKKLVRDNQYLNEFSDREDSIFIASEKLIYDYKIYLRDLTDDKITDNLNAISDLKLELKLLKQERRLLRHLIWAENFRYRIEIRNENLKYSKYLKRAQKFDDIIKKNMAEIR